MQLLSVTLFSVFVLGLCALLSPPEVAAEPTGLKPGDTPPKYVGRLLEGTDVQMDLSSGKAYVVTFWASWCAPCLQELPILSNLQKKVGTDSILVIAVNIEDRDVFRKVRGPIGELGLVAAYDPNASARKGFSVGAIPHMVVVGRNGKITAIRKGYSVAKLEAYVADFNRALAAPLQDEKIESPNGVSK